MANKYELPWTGTEVEERLRTVDDTILNTPQTLTEDQQSQARANIGAVSMEQVEELLGIEEEFNVSGELVEFDLDIETDTELNVVSRIHRDATWGESNKLVLHQVSGCNFFDLVGFIGASAGKVIEKNGLTATVNADCTLTVKGTNSSNGWTNIISTTLWSGNYSSRVYPAGTYIVPNDFTISIRAAQYPENNVNVPGLTGNLKGKLVIPEPFRIIAVNYAVAGGKTVDVTIPLGFFYGGSIPETGREYTGNIYTATFDNAVYEGEYNWTTGELKDADGNTIAYYEPQSIVKLSDTNYFWTGFGENTVSNVSSKNLEKVVVALGKAAPEEAVPSICDFTLTPTTKNYAINLAGDSRDFFRKTGYLFNGMEVPLVTTRGSFVVTNSDGVDECKLPIPELINYNGISDTMTWNQVTKRWSDRFYITRSPDFKETVDDGSGNTTTNPNTIATWIFSKKEFEKLGLPIETTDIPIVSPIFTTTTNDKLVSSKRHQADPYSGVLSYDEINDNYVFKCRARLFYEEGVYNWTNGYFCYPLKEEIRRDDNMVSLYMSAGYSVRFEQDDAFDEFWEYSLTQRYCPFSNDSHKSLWSAVPSDASTVAYLIDTTPNVGIFVPRSVEDALYEAEHIAKRLNYKDEQSDDYEVNSYGWIGVGDGVTDYTDKIQSKLTEIHNTSNGGTIYLGTGTYPISDRLIVYSNTRIIGCGTQTVIKQTSDNTDVIVLNGNDITLEDFCIQLAGACTELTACVYANSGNSAGDDGYPSNFYVTNLTMENIFMSGNYRFEYVDGKPILGDVYNNYKGVGIRCAHLYFNYAHVDNVHGKYLMATVHSGGGGNYYNITSEFCRYAVYTGGVNCQYFINGHSYYDGNVADGYVSMSDYIVYEDSGHFNKYTISSYDSQHCKSNFYFGGRSQTNSYTINGNFAVSAFGNYRKDDNHQIERMVVDLGRGNIHVAAYQNIPFAIGNHTKQLSGQTSMAISDPAIRNALSGAGVWGNISSNVTFDNYGLELSEVCRYPSEKASALSHTNLPSVVSTVAASESNPVEIEIDISNRPIYNRLGYFIQFDHRYVASDFTVSYDTTGNGAYNLSYEVKNNTDVTVFWLMHQNPAYLIHRIKFTFTKPLQIENFTYEDSAFRPFTINYNPDGLIGICNIGMTVNDYAGRSFLGECGGSLYGNVDMHQNTLKNLPAPVDDGDAVSKAYLEERLAALEQLLAGKDVFGYVDDNNNIVLNGALVNGTYTIKYEMEDGSVIDIGDLVLDTNVYYSVTNNLTQCTNSNSATEIAEGESYSATITAKDGYELKSVSVTMGGSPVTVSGGTISIASVTGNIVITAVAEEQAVAPAYKNWLPLSVDADGNDYKGDNGEDGYKTGYRLSTSSGNESALSGACVTGFIPFNKVNDVFRIKNMTLHDTSFNANGLVIYDANKSRVYGATSQSAGNFAGSITADGNGVYKFSPGNWTSVTTGNGFIRFSCGGISDDTIVTINEEIV